MDFFRWLVALLLLALCGLCHAQAPKVDLVRVVKSERALYLMGGGEVLRRYDIALGRSPVGHKQREGDRRTPEGRYVLDYRKADSAFHRALHVSYPDARDRANARRLGVSPGGAIMIHGQPNGYTGPALAYDWTDGCIALSNDDMDEVWALVRIPTPIEIVP